MLQNLFCILLVVTLKSCADLGFLLQYLTAPLNQVVEATELMLKLKHLSLMFVVCGLLLHLQATAGTTSSETLTVCQITKKM